MRVYEIILVTGGMIGGHYAIQRPDGTTFGKEHGFDKTRARSVCDELNNAIRLGIEESIQRVDMAGERN